MEKSQEVTRRLHFPEIQLFLLAAVRKKGATICCCTCAVLTETERRATLHLSAAQNQICGPLAPRENTRSDSERRLIDQKGRRVWKLTQQHCGEQKAFLMDCGNHSLSERHQINSKPRPLSHRSHRPQATVHLATETRIQTLCRPREGPQVHPPAIPASQHLPESSRGS